MRPLFGPVLLHEEAFAICVAACDRAMREVAERKECVEYTPDGFHLLESACLVRLEAIDPGQWEVSITRDGSNMRTVAMEVSHRKVRVYAGAPPGLCPNCGALTDAATVGGGKPAHSPYCPRKGKE